LFVDLIWQDLIVSAKVFDGESESSSDDECMRTVIVLQVPAAAADCERMRNFWCVLLLIRNGDLVSVCLQA
jgi:hypothetical protein